MRDVAVVGAPEPTKGAVPFAFVVLRTPGATSAEELTSFFHSVGPHYAYPRVIEFVADLPLTGAGKLDRSALETRAKALAEAQR